MSAYICDKNHIVYLVQAAISRSIVHFGPFSWVWNRDHSAGTYDRDTLACDEYEKAADVANMLWQENIRSVSARYPNESSATLPGPNGGAFVITRENITAWRDHFEPVQVIKSIHCYRYQSCEHDEWEDSQAFAFCAALEHAAISALPGYDGAEWGAPKRPSGTDNRVLLSSLVRK